MIAQLRGELKHHLDYRLAAHHEEMFRRFSEESNFRSEDLMRRFCHEGTQTPQASHQASRQISPQISQQASQQASHQTSLDPNVMPNRSRARTMRTGLNSTISEGARARSLPHLQPMRTENLGNFEHTERIKKQMIQMMQPRRLVAAVHKGDDFNGFTVRIRTCLETPLCEFLVGLVILSNVFFLGFEVQVVRGIQEERIPIGLKAMEYTYTVFFTVELSARLLGYGWRSFLMGPGKVWNLIDTVLVTTSLSEKIMDLFLNVNSDLHYLRIIRIARTVRVLRVVRIVTFFRPLRILVYSVVNTVRSLAWTFILLLIIVYLFAVTFTLAASQARASSDVSAALQARLDANFGSLWSSMFLLFKSITGGVDWTVASDPLEELSPVWSNLFLAYIAFCQLAVLNVVTGVVCQTAIESARQDQDIVVQAQVAMKQRYVGQLQELFKHFDENQTGKITLAEFEEHLADEDMIHYFEILELTIDEAWSLFKLLDTSNTGVIDVEDFVSGCLKLRGTAKSIDMHMLMYQSKWAMDRLASLVASMNLVEKQMEGFQPPPMRSSSPRGRSRTGAF